MADESEGLLSQDDINAALAAAGLEAPAAIEAPPEPVVNTPDVAVEAFAEVARQVGETAPAAAPASLRAFDIPDLDPRGLDSAASQAIDLLRDVELDVKIELGRSRMLVDDVLRLGEGSVVELDKLAGDPVDVFVNNRLVARGEVLVLNDNFCVRINEIVAKNDEDGWAAPQ